MEGLINEQGQFTEQFTTKLPEFLGDSYYNDPETRQQPTKVFENVKDFPTLLKNYANAQRTISKGRTAFEAEHAEKVKGMVKLPGEGSTPEEISAFRKAIGVPDKPEGYKEAFTYDPKGDDAAYYGALADTLSKASVEAGIPMTAAKAVWEKATAQMKAYQDDIEKKGLAMMKADIELQKAEKGAKYDGYVEDISRALSKVGSEELKAGETVTVGQKFTDILTTFGLLQYDNGKLTGGHPAVMKFAAELVPLLNSGKSHIGKEGGPEPEQEGKFNYDYLDKPQ